MGSRNSHQASPDTAPQRRCARAAWCSAKTRDPESGEWFPAPANQPLCPADRTVLIATLGEFPACYERLGGLSVSPVRRNRPVRVAPGSRVLVNPEADALMREAAHVLAGWAARVRDVPGLSLAGHGHVPGSLKAVTADCGDLAKHPDPLLALAPEWMARIWTWPPGSPAPGWLEDEIGGLDAVVGGDGWVKAFTRLDGEDAALEVLDLRARVVRLLGETPAPPELLDGIPCRSCEAMSSLEVLPASHPDPAKPEPVFCRCTEAGCKDEMTRAEYDDWVRQYDAWVKGAGVLTCRRCSLGQCADSPSACQWRGCSCRARGHRKAA